MAIRYRYAGGSADRIWDIRTLTRATRHAGAPYQCLGCGGALRPHLGTRTAPHFHHQRESPGCSLESYLHQSAKRLFLERFREARADDKQALLLEREVRTRCTTFQDQTGVTCPWPFTETLDLGRYFNTALPETGIARWRADVLLKSEQHDEVLLIEFRVTHACEEEKRETGLRILEFGIEQENDLEWIRHGHWRLEDPRLQAYHLQPPKPGPYCRGNCTTTLRGLRVSADGRYTLRNTTLGQWAASEPAERAAFRTLLTAGRNLAQATREALHAGVPIRSCLVCLGQGYPDDTGKRFCRTLQTPIHSPATAASCARFQIAPDLDALDRHNQRALARRDRSRQAKHERAAAARDANKEAARARAAEEKRRRREEQRREDDRLRQRSDKLYEANLREQNDRRAREAALAMDRVEQWQHRARTDRESQQGEWAEIERTGEPRAQMELVRYLGRPTGSAPPGAAALLRVLQQANQQLDRFNLGDPAGQAYLDTVLGEPAARCLPSIEAAQKRRALQLYTLEQWLHIPAETETLSADADHGPQQISLLDP